MFSFQIRILAPNFIKKIGATQNSIRVAQWMFQIPGVTSYMGCIGKDKFGEEMKKNAQAAGVTAHYYGDEAAPTGTCAVCVVGGERLLLPLHFLLRHYYLPELGYIYQLPTPWRILLKDWRLSAKLVISWELSTSQLRKKGLHRLRN